MRRPRISHVLIGIGISVWISLGLLEVDLPSSDHFLASRFAMAVSFWIGGAIGGVVWSSLEPLRRRKVGRYAAWFISVLIGFSVWALRALVYDASGESIIIMVWLMGAIGIGLSLAVTSEWLRSEFAER